MTSNDTGEIRDFPLDLSSEEKKDTMDLLISKVEILLQQRRGEKVNMSTIFTKMDGGIDMLLGVEGVKKENIEVLDDELIAELVGKLKKSKTDLETFNNTLNIILTVIGGIAGIII